MAKSEEPSNGYCSSSSGEEDGDAAWRAAINSIAGSTTYPNPNPNLNLNSNGDEKHKSETKTPQLKHYQLQAQKLLHDMLENTLEIVKEPDSTVLNYEDPKINQEEGERGGEEEAGIRLFKHVHQQGIVFDHFDGPEPPKRRPILLPADYIDEKSKKFKRQVKAVAVDGKDLIAAANDAYKKSLAKFEARDAAAKAKAKREEERVNNLKKIRGERWLPSMAKEMQVRYQR
ncbi:hypothetical protein PIB30_075543 [Stylosanthes scabra]|uniref:Uncharacterized protein n=1 Tax=Stylosanthes scabra TaxID=79078 RepID=A0ABU6XMY7_9FABA|nr:hypothetical protein [Stylosanthes scabra]